MYRRTGTGLSRPAAAAVLALVLLVSACTSDEPDFGAWLDEAPRTIALVVSEAALPEPKFHVMKHQYGMDALEGAGSGTVIALYLGSECNSEDCLVALLVLLPAMAVGGALVGLVASEPRVVDSWLLAEAEATKPLAAIVEEVTPPVRGRGVGDLLVSLIRDGGEHTVFIVSPEEAAALAPDDTDATVTVDVPHVGLHGDPGDDPETYIQMEFAVKAVWKSGIQDDIFRLNGGRTRLSEWETEDYQPVREAISRLEGEFGKIIKEDWFGHRPGSV